MVVSLVSVLGGGVDALYVVGVDQVVVPAVTPSITYTQDLSPALAATQQELDEHFLTSAPTPARAAAVQLQMRRRACGPRSWFYLRRASTGLRSWFSSTAGLGVRWVRGAGRDLALAALRGRWCVILIALWPRSLIALWHHRRDDTAVGPTLLRQSTYWLAPGQGAVRSCSWRLFSRSGGNSCPAL